MLLPLGIIFVAFFTCRCTATTEAQGTDETAANNGRLFTPPDGRTLEEWTRHRGMANDMYQRVRNKTEQLIRNEYGTSPPRRQRPSNTPPEDSDEEIPAFETLDGCIWLSEEQIDALLNRNQPIAVRHRRAKRQLIDFTKFPHYKFTLPIVFRFDGRHSATEQAVIRSAFQHVADNTCVRFREISPDAIYNDHHIVVANNGEGSGCYSYVGMVAYIKPQPLNLEPRCTDLFGIPVHEICHALGLYHENQRSDRDAHVEILRNNIDARYYVDNYQQVSTDDVVAYNYGSIMHYASGDFAVNTTLDTLRALNPLYQQNMGQRVELSFNDARAINIAYCNTTCDSAPRITCQRGGYQDPNNCARCKCPDGFAGTLCERLADSTSSCGGQLELTSIRNHFLIKSLDYDSTGYYPSYSQCNWLITAPVGSHVRLQFVGLFRVRGLCKACVYHWVEIKYKTDLGPEGARFCCDVLPTVATISESNSMMIIFKANFSNTAYWKGFQAIASIASTTTVCDSSTQFTCTNGRCVQLTDVCDYENDCQDNSDEMLCLYPPADLTKSILFSINNEPESASYLYKFFGDPDNYASKLDEGFASDVSISVVQTRAANNESFHSLAASYRDQVVYWGDKSSSRLNRGLFVYMNSTDIHHLTPVPATDQIKGIAFDWLSENVYYIDGVSKFIGVVSTAPAGGYYWKRLVTGLNDPRHIVVNPISRHIFWIDGAEIKRADLTGRNQIRIAHPGYGGLVAPVKLAVHIESQIVFWLDPSAERFGMVALDGSRFVYWEGSFFARISTMTFHTNYVFFGDGQQPKFYVYRVAVNWTARTFVPLSQYTFQGIAGSVTSMTTFSAEAQPDAASACVSNNGGCSQFCFAVSTTQRVCDCSTGFFLASDSMTCVSNFSTSTTSSSSTTTTTASTTTTTTTTSTTSTPTTTTTATPAQATTTKKTTPRPPTTSTSTTTTTTTTPESTTVTTSTPYTKQAKITTPKPSTHFTTTPKATPGPPTTSTPAKTPGSTVTTSAQKKNTPTRQTTTTPTTTSTTTTPRRNPTPTTTSTTTSTSTRTTTTSEPTTTTTGSTSCEGPLWIVRRDWNSFFGILYPSILTLEDCRQACLLNLDCHAVDYDIESTDKRCWLHLDINYQETGGLYQGVDQHSISDRRCVACFGSRWTIYRNENSFYGVRQPDISNLVDCLRRCVADSLCVAVDYTFDVGISDSARCWLHNSISTVQRTRGFYPGTWQFVARDRCSDNGGISETTTKRRGFTPAV